MSRTEALERYRALPLPTTSEEAWRFTDLAGFDPDSFSANGASAAVAPGLVDIDVGAVASVTENGIEIERAPEGITFEPLSGDHPRLGELVGAEEKFAAHNTALWESGLLVHVPKGLVLEQPLYVRISNSAENGTLFWRMLVIAEAESRFSLIEEYASASPDLGAYMNAVVELHVEQAAKVEYISVQNLARETWHFASHRARVGRDAELDWVTAGFGTKKGKVRIENDLAGEGATSRVTGAYFADGSQHLDYDTFQEHLAPNTTSDFAFKGALRDTASVVWRGMIKVETDRARVLHRSPEPDRARTGPRGARRSARGPNPAPLGLFRPSGRISRGAYVCHFSLTGARGRVLPSPGRQQRGRRLRSRRKRSTGCRLQIHVVFGKQASFITRQTVLEILEGIPNGEPSVHLWERRAPALLRPPVFGSDDLQRVTRALGAPESRRRGSQGEPHGFPLERGGRRLCRALRSPPPQARVGSGDMTYAVVIRGRAALANRARRSSAGARAELPS